MVWPLTFLINMFTALKGSQFYFYFLQVSIRKLSSCYFTAPPFVDFPRYSLTFEGSYVVINTPSCVFISRFLSPSLMVVGR